jgi:hypothetical protein
LVSAFFVFSGFGVDESPVFFIDFAICNNDYAVKFQRVFELAKLFFKIIFVRRLSYKVTI